MNVAHISARGHLRAATRHLHDKVDAHAAAFDLSTAEGLTRFLALMLRGCSAVEAVLDAAGAADIWECWPDRRRTDLLLADLNQADLEGARAEIARAPCLAPSPSHAMIWGMLYVLEGSRLGGRLLARNGRLAFHSRFLEDGAHCRLWPVFVGRLEAAIVMPPDRREAVEGACFAFSQFLKDDDRNNIG